MNTNTDKTPSSETTSQSPAHVCDSGRIRASIWEAVANDAPTYKVTISRSYKKEDTWHRGYTFFPEELAGVVEVAARAQRWIERQKRQQLQPELAAA